MNKLTKGARMMRELTIPESAYGTCTLPADGNPTYRVKCWEQLAERCIIWMGNWQERATEILHQIEQDIVCFRLTNELEKEIKDEVESIRDMTILIPLLFANMQMRITGARNTEINSYIREPTVSNFDNLLRWWNHCDEEETHLGRIMAELHVGADICSVLENALTRMRLTQAVKRFDRFEEKEAAMQAEIDQLRADQAKVKGLVTTLQTTIDELTPKTPVAPEPERTRLEEFKQWAEQVNPTPFDHLLEVVIGASLTDYLSLSNTRLPFMYEYEIINHKGEKCENEIVVHCGGQAIALVAAAFCNELAWMQILKEADASIINVIVASFWNAHNFPDEQSKTHWEQELLPRAVQEAYDQKINANKELQWYVGRLRNKLIHLVDLNRTLGTGTDPNAPESYASNGYEGENLVGKLLQSMATKYGKRFNNPKLVGWSKGNITKADDLLKTMWFPSPEGTRDDQYTAITQKIASNYNTQETMPIGQIQQALEDRSSQQMDTSESPEEQDCSSEPTKGREIVTEAGVSEALQAALSAGQPQENRSLSETINAVLASMPIEQTQMLESREAQVKFSQAVQNAMALQRQTTEGGKVNVEEAVKGALVSMDIDGRQGFMGAAPKPQRVASLILGSNGNRLSTGSTGTGKEHSPLIDLATPGAERKPAPTPKPTSGGGLMRMLKTFGLEKASWAQTMENNRPSPAAEKPDTPDGSKPSRVQTIRLTELLTEGKVPTLLAGGYGSKFSKDDFVDLLPAYIPDASNNEPPIARHPYRKGVSANQKPENYKYTEFKAVETVVNPISMEHELVATQVPTINQEEITDKEPFYIVLIGDTACFFTEQIFNKVSRASNINGWPSVKGVFSLGRACTDLYWKDLQTIFPIFVAPTDTVVVVRTINDFNNLVALRMSGACMETVDAAIKKIANEYIRLVQLIRAKNSTAVLLLCIGNAVTDWDRKFNDPCGEDVAAKLYAHLQQHVEDHKGTDPSADFIPFNLTENLCNYVHNLNKRKHPGTHASMQLNGEMREYCDRSEATKHGTNYIYTEVLRMIYFGMAQRNVGDEHWYVKETNQLKTLPHYRTSTQAQPTVSNNFYQQFLTSKCAQLQPNNFYLPQLAQWSCPGTLTQSKAGQATNRAKHYKRRHM